MDGRLRLDGGLFRSAASCPDASEHQRYDVLTADPVSRASKAGSPSAVSRGASEARKMSNGLDAAYDTARSSPREAKDFYYGFMLLPKVNAVPSTPLTLSPANAMISLNQDARAEASKPRGVPSRARSVPGRASRRAGI